MSVLPLFVCVRTQLFVVCAGQLLAEAAAHTPAVQVCPDVHALPHLPQLFGSVIVLTQTALAPVPHTVGVLGLQDKAHVPALHV